VRVNAPQFVLQIQAHLPPAWRIQQSPVVDRLYSFVFAGRGARPGVQRFHLLYGDLQNLARTGDAEDLFEAFESDLNNFIGQSARRRFFVHAGVVGWRGRAIVIPGRSYSGKTTLVKEFLRYGATYYSDEFAVLDGRGCVNPFAKPLAMREETTQKQSKVSATELGVETGVKPLPVGLLLFTHYQSSARWHPRAISPGRAALGLLANALSARGQPEQTLTFLQRAVRGARILNGVRGEAKEVVRAILGH